MLLWFVAACTKEAKELSGNDNKTDEEEVPVNFMSKLAVGDGDQVSQLRIIIFSTRSSDPYGPKILAYNELIDTEEYTAITYIGYNDIYVIGNEPVDLSKVRTPGDLKIQMDTEINQAASEFVFYRQLRNVNVRSKNEIYLEGEVTPVSQLDIQLQRVVAKLTVQFDLNTQIYENEDPTGKYLNLESMELVRIPKYSYLIPDTYKKENGFMNNRTFSLQDSSMEEHHFVWSSGDIYLPEYLLEDNSYKTFLRIKGTSDGIIHTYTLPVGDGMNPADSYSTDWNITRNRHYSLTIKGIKGYGEESLEANARVAGWSEINVPVDVPGTNYLLVNKNKVEVNSIRFYTYVRFSSSHPIEVIRTNVNESIMLVETEYDDETHKSGRVGFKRGNWNQDTYVKYTATLRSGTASVDIILEFSPRDKTGELGKGDWATAMGYSSSANEILTHPSELIYYNAEMYHKGGDTGCRNYYPNNVGQDDKTKGKGCWRLPTANECASYSKLTFYWSIGEFDADFAYTACYGNEYESILIPNMIEACKSSSNPYFCVLDTRPPELSDFIVSDEDIEVVAKDKASLVCESMETGTGTGWRLPTGDEMKYVFSYAGTNGLPNNFFSDSYWGKNENTLIVATMSDPDGSETTDELRNKNHMVRCVKSRF